MTTPSGLSPGWLMPPGAAENHAAWYTVLLPAGVLWDAVRTRRDTGLILLERILARPEDRDVCGPVICSEREDCLDWLISPGSSDSWPDDVELLSTGDWLRAPLTELTVSREASWAYLPSAERLSGPAWLATALWEQYQAGAA